MKSAIVTLFSVFLISGCSSIPVVPKSTEVLVKVPVPCKVIAPSKPDFATNNLGIGENIFEQVKALLAERKQRQGYELELEAAIESCK